MMWRIYVRQHPRLGPWARRVERQPAWVTRLALTAAVIVVVVPLALLALAAIAVGFVVFVALALVATVVGAVASVLQRPENGPTEGGRSNVRVVDRQ